MTSRLPAITAIRAGLSACCIVCACLTSAFGQSQDELQTLLFRQQQLTDKIRMLEKEQNLLQFQRSCASLDSKYLLIDYAAGKGTLRYRNRILRDFSFVKPDHPRKRKIPQGLMKLSQKTDGTKRKRRLFFGESLVMQAASSGSTAGGTSTTIPVVRLKTKDFSAIFFAIENGTMAYLIN